MNQSQIDQIRKVLPLWYSTMAWAKELLIRAFALEQAQDILRLKRHGTHQIPGTAWFIRTHGVGVDIYKTPEVGGIDFDFDKPHPDEWRLRIFFEKQLNDGQLPYVQYQELAENEELLKQVIREVLRVA